MTATRLFAFAVHVLEEGAVPAPTPSPAPVPVDPFVGEVAALRDVLGGSGLLLFLLVVLLAWGLAAGIARLLLVLRRTGVGGRLHWSGRVQVAVSAVLALWVLGLLARFLLSRAPLLSLALAVAFAGGALLSLAVRLHQVAGGALLVLRGRVNEGDRLTVGEVEGTVERLGLTRLKLRRTDGSSVYLPTSLLDARPLQVAHRGTSRELVARLERPGPFTAADREEARRIALLCPHRVLGTEVDVRSPRKQPNTLVLRLTVWGEPALRDAERFVERALERPPRGPEEGTGAGSSAASRPA